MPGACKTDDIHVFMVLMRTIYNQNKHAIRDQRAKNAAQHAPPIPSHTQRLPVRHQIGAILRLPIRVDPIIMIVHSAGEAGTTISLRLYSFTQSNPLLPRVCRLFANAS